MLEEAARCKRCPELRPWRKFPTKAHGNLDSLAMIVSEAPGIKSLRHEKFWMGQAGQRIRKVLSGYEVKLEDVFYLTDILKCGPPDNRKPRQNEINNCGDFLTREIEIIQPKHIVVFGGVALRYFLERFVPRSPFEFHSMEEVQSNKGFTEIEFNNFLLIPLLHPSCANRFKFISYDIYREHLSEIFGRIINLQGHQSKARSKYGVV